MPKHAISPEFLFTLQSYSFIPTIDTPTRVYSSSAMLIDNIFTNKYCRKITSGNIISDISDHYSQFCLTESSCETDFPKKTMIRDFSRCKSIGDRFLQERKEIMILLFRKFTTNSTNWLINMLHLNLYQSVNSSNP